MSFNWNWSHQSHLKSRESTVSLLRKIEYLKHHSFSIISLILSHLLAVSKSTDLTHSVFIDVSMRWIDACCVAGDVSIQIHVWVSSATSLFLLLFFFHSMELFLLLSTNCHTEVFAGWVDRVVLNNPLVSRTDFATFVSWLFSLLSQLIIDLSYSAFLLDQIFSHLHFSLFSFSYTCYFCRSHSSLLSSLLSPPLLVWC